MFYRCKYLAYIDLSSLNINKINDMSNMFFGCDFLINVRFSNVTNEN